MLIAMAVIAILLSRSIAKPIRALKEYMAVLQGGDYDQQVPFTDQRDDVGQMAGSIQSFRESLIKNRENDQGCSGYQQSGSWCACCLPCNK